MFFGGMFLAYTLYRYKYPEAFAAASNHLDIRLGSINTVVLIVSSFTMAMAVFSTQVGKRRNSIIFLIGTMTLGLAFLVIKGFEYHSKYVDNLIPGTLIPGHPFNPNLHEMHLPPDVAAGNLQMFYVIDRKSTRLNSSHTVISYAVFCL